MNKNIIYLTHRETFSASHRLHSAHLSDEENKRVFGKCNYPNGHGHNYTLEVVVKGTPDPKTGMVMNLFDIRDLVMKHVIEKVDHRHFNLDIAEFKDSNPTVENITVLFWQWLKAVFPAGSLYEIRLHETENSHAIFRGE